MKIAIVGLGLIGGSFAKSIKKNTKHTVVGFDTDADVLSFALSVGAIDIAGNDEQLAQCDVTIICLYPNMVAPYVKSKRGIFKKGSIVTDAAGVKECVCNPLKDEPFDFTFIGAHPMAGRECGGFENATENLFDGASFIFTPEKGDEDALNVLVGLAHELHFGKTVITTPKQHDEIIAYTSQIAHVLACAYVLSPRALEHFGFSAGSFRDVSRVAKINEELWTQLFLDNKGTLCAEIDTLIGNLKEIKSYIESGNEKSLKEILRKGRETKEKLDR